MVKIISYFTESYRIFADRLMFSLMGLDLDYCIERVQDLGSWEKNVLYKPTFILKKFDEFGSVLYVDADAVFERYPSLLNELDCDVAVHQLDHRPSSRPRKRPLPSQTILSGTVFFGKGGKDIIKRWIRKCKGSPRAHLPDQYALKKTLNGFTQLPLEYCTIFDDYFRPKEPVIVHYQASRLMRNG